MWPLAAAMCKAEWRSYTVARRTRLGSLCNTASTISTSPPCTALNNPCSSLGLQLSSWPIVLMCCFGGEGLERWRSGLWERWRNLKAQDCIYIYIYKYLCYCSSWPWNGERGSGQADSWYCRRQRAAAICFSGSRFAINNPQNANLYGLVSVKNHVSISTLHSTGCYLTTSKFQIHM